METQNQMKNIEVSASENTTENSDNIIDGLKTLRLKYPLNPMITHQFDTKKIWSISTGSNFWHGF